MLLIIFSRIGLVFWARISQNFITLFLKNRSHIILQDSIICCNFVSRYMHTIHLIVLIILYNRSYEEILYAFRALGNLRMHVACYK